MMEMRETFLILTLRGQCPAMEERGFGEQEQKALLLGEGHRFVRPRLGALEIATKRVAQAGHAERYGQAMGVVESLGEGEGGLTTCQSLTGIATRPECNRIPRQRVDPLVLPNTERQAVMLSGIVLG